MDWKVTWYITLLCIKETTQEGYQAIKTPSLMCKDNKKWKDEEKNFAQKFNQKRVSCHPIGTQQALQGLKKAQQASNLTQQTPDQANRQGKKVYATVWENIVYIRSLQWDSLRVYANVKAKGTYMLWKGQAMSYIFYIF